MADHTFDKEVVSTDCVKAPLNSRWTIKLSVIFVVVFGVGILGYYDASIKYPKKGVRFADWAQWQYLEQAEKANDEDFGVFLRESSVTNPVEELARLSDPNTKSSKPLRAAMMEARLAWFEALNVVGLLDEGHTVIESPQSTLNELRTKWQTATSVPTPLHTFDLVVQWMIMALCWAIALVMGVHMLKTRTKKYAWVADSMTLTLPSGSSITPDDLEEVDKRKWDKFIVFLRIKDGHSSLGGQEISVDTYQHSFVEDWILAMEEKAFPSQEDDDASSITKADDSSD